MSNPTILVQKGTGRRFVATPVLLKRKDMVPEGVDEVPATDPTETQPPEGAVINDIEQPDYIVIDGESVPIDHASKKALDEYAEINFGESLDRRRGHSELAAAVRALIIENGHPDAE